MAEFNLIDEGWIPCIDLAGKRVEWGIRDTLLKAHELREVCDDSPLVTVSLHRLLLAILYRAHEGPSDRATWESLYRDGRFVRDGLVDGYLRRWHDRFYLFDDDHPFFQMPRFEMTSPVAVTRLATECASGNRETLFDHCTDSEDICWRPARSARWLVASQSFALGLGRSGNAQINGKTEAMPYTADAIALRGITVWLQGVSLFHTLLFNLAPVDDSSIPPWELEDSNQYRDRLYGGHKSPGDRSLGVADRLTWQSRLIRLLPQNGSVSRMYLAQGRSADKSLGDPMKPYRLNREEGISPVPLSANRAAWRDAHAIFSLPKPGSGECRPECFNLLSWACQAGVVPRDSRPVTNVVGLASLPNKAGKFVLWRHDRMPIPAEVLADGSMVERLKALVEKAESTALELRARTHRVARFYRVAVDRVPNRSEKEDIRLLSQKLDPRPAYWARLEEHFYALLEGLSTDLETNDGDVKSDEQQVASRAWRDHVKLEAQRSFEESVRSLGTTGRAIQAIARARTDFGDEDLQLPPQKTAVARRRTKGGKNR